MNREKFYAPVNTVTSMDLKLLATYAAFVDYYKR